MVLIKRKRPFLTMFIIRAARISAASVNLRINSTALTLMAGGTGVIYSHHTNLHMSRSRVTVNRASVSKARVVLGVGRPLRGGQTWCPVPAQINY